MGKDADFLVSFLPGYADFEEGYDDVFAAGAVSDESGN